MSSNEPLIFFVDDEPEFINGWMKALNTVGKVKQCRDAQEAEELFTKKSGVISCAVVDVQMPIPETWDDEAVTAAMSGYRTGVILLERVQDAIRKHHVPIFVLTNQKVSEVEADLRASGYSPDEVMVCGKTRTPPNLLANLVRVSLRGRAAMPVKKGTRRTTVKAPARKAKVKVRPRAKATKKQVKKKSKGG